MRNKSIKQTSDQLQSKMELFSSYTEFEAINSTNSSINGDKGKLLDKYIIYNNVLNVVKV